MIVGEEIVCAVPKTLAPLPVSSVSAAARLALDGVARKAATLVPSPVTLAMAGVVESASVATLKALAEQPDPIDEMDVRRACWSDDGVWQA